MATATRTLEINVEPEKMFEVLADFNAYPEFLDVVGMTKVEVVRDDGDVKEVTHWVKKMGATVYYKLRYRLEEPKKMSWTFVKGQMMKDNNGSWELSSAGEGKCQAIYSAEVKFGMLVPKSVVSVLVNNELPDLLAAFKKRAESRS